MSLKFRSLIFLAIVLQTYGTTIATDDVSFCSWSKKPFECSSSEFRCLTVDKCVSREFYCNDFDDCGDNSDERFCSSPCAEDFVQCGGWSGRCIPVQWICNGYRDCGNGDDETNCGRRTPSRTVSYDNKTIRNTDSLHKIKNWLFYQRREISSFEKWGHNVDRFAILLYLAGVQFNSNRTSVQEKYIYNEMAYELNIQLLSRLSSMELEDIPSTELASYLNAFLVTCIDPRKFHNYNIVQELRHRVDKENYTNPYVLLSLCNAGEIITESDKKKLLDAFENRHRTFWTGMQAVVVMALACANKQPGNEIDSDTLNKLTLELKQRQYRNGTVENLSTTALVMQALISTNSERDPDNFDESKAFEELMRNQKVDGSFGDLMTTFLVTPIITCKSLADIHASNNCQYGSRDEISALVNLSRKQGHKIRVQYSLWFENEKDLERTLNLRVPLNTALYNVMELASELDSRFKFEYTVKDRKPYINAISGMRDDPLTGKFWFLYKVQNGEPILLKESPADITPKENDYYVMWYRRGTWIE